MNSVPAVYKIFIFVSIVFLSIFYSNSVEAYGSEEEQIKIEEAIDQNNFSKAFTLIKPFADDGDKEAQEGICLLTWHGFGPDKDIRSALSWCDKAKDSRKSTEEIFSTISQIISLISSKNEVITKDDALGRLEKLAQGGNPKAQWLMYKSHNLDLVDLKNEDNDAKRKWLKAAEESNYPEALFKIAKPWFNSDNPEQREKYVLYMTEAAEQGITDAMYHLGLYYKPYGDGNNPEYPYKDWAKATSWFRKNAISSGGSTNLYEILRNANNPERDYDEGLEWLIRVANDGYMPAKIELADIYLKGEELPVNIDRALELLQSGANEKALYHLGNFAQANYKIAHLYHYNSSGRKNYKLAEKHYRKIINRYNGLDDKYRSLIRPWPRSVGLFAAPFYSNLILAKYQLAILYSEGHAKPNHENEIAELFLSSAELDNPRGTRWLQYKNATESGIEPDVLKSIQRNLARLGYKPGPADGVLGKKTFDAIRALQCSNSIEVDGIPTQALSALLKKQKSQRRYTKKTLSQRLHDSVSKLDLDCVNAALAEGADPNARGPLGTAHLRFIDNDEMKWLQLQITQILLNAGSKISLVNSNIFEAISCGHLKLVKLLLDNGELPDRRIGGKPLIHWAAYYRQPAVIDLLVEYGAQRISQRQIAQEQITNVSINWGGSGRLVQDALDKGAYINGSNAAGTTPLVSALDHGFYHGRGQYQLIKFLLDEGADPNLEVKINRFRWDDIVVEGNMPLHLFVRMNSQKMNDDVKNPTFIHEKEYATNTMHLLLERGAKVAARDSQGMTPLHWAAKIDNLAAAQILLNNGAYTTHHDKRGAIPIEYAESADMIALLQSSTESGIYKKKAPPKQISGSGFLVSKDGLIVTNAHVVEKCISISINFQDERTLNATVISADRTNDLSLLKVQEDKTGVESQSHKTTDPIFKNIATLRNRDVKLGESVVVAGFPFGDLLSHSVKITTGVVSSTRGIGDNTGQFQIDAAIQPGNSGGPIYDRAGNVIGAVVSQLSKQKIAATMGILPENSNFGIKVSTIKTFLEATDVEFVTLTPDNEHSVEYVSEIAENQTVMVTCQN